MRRVETPAGLPDKVNKDTPIAWIYAVTDRCRCRNFVEEQSGLAHAGLLDGDIGSTLT